MKKIALVLISHGKMAEETLKSAQMIAGHIDGAYSISMDEKEGAEGVARKIREVMDDLKNYESILVMVDLIGGTPSNVAVKELFKANHVEIVSGFNLGMVLEFATSSLQDIGQLKDYLIEIGKNGIKDVFGEMRK
ncbi:MAG TPA: PTS sugar transporter subunit IIA [Thermoanaerobacterales bacterium]|nr:PTS sugar transporter subunit IIA [Thermoanaerobacterales bacterium]